MAPLSSAALQGGNLEITVDSGDALDVREFSVEERMSSLFTVTVIAMSDNAAIDFDMVVGRPARFTLRAGQYERSWSGICSQIQQVGAEEEGLSTYNLTLVPELWLATQRRNYRIFQQGSEPDIVEKMLDEWGIQREVKLTGTYKKRKYRVQYAESDYAFMCRMLEDAGISFYFAEADGQTKLVLSDAPHLAPLREPRIPFKDDISMVTGEYVTGLRIGQKVRPGRYTMRDHDYRRPPTNQPISSAEAARVDIEKRLERYHYAPGAFLFGTDKGESTPTADDRGKVRVDDAEAALLSQKRLDAKRSSAKRCTFDTNAPDVAPGMVLGLLDHPRPDLGPSRRLLVVEAKHAGTFSGAWSHRCEVRSADIPFRPPLATPKPKAIGAESATVVGPPGEEIHTDEFGRVRVHFHWDRESKLDETSSCWIHVSQPWGGAGFGGINLPRVGQEVLVEFLGGDPDRPIIVGRVYTNLQKVPYKLPDQKTQSGWKSASSPGGGGFNELRFEDAKGKELLYVQAEKDLRRLTKNNEDVNIGQNRTKHVAANEREVTGQNRSVVVGVSRSTQIGAVDSTTVGQMFSVMVLPPGEGGSESTPLTMRHDKIELSTPGGAKITLEGSKITLEAVTIRAIASGELSATASAKATFGGYEGAHLGSGGGDVTINGGPLVKINGSGLPSARLGDPVGGIILNGASTVLVNGPTLPFPVTVLPNGDIKVGNGIIISGDQEFQIKTLAGLHQIALTPTGADLLTSIDQSCRTVTIQPLAPGDSGNATGYTSPDDRFALADGSPGAGTDAIISYDPDLTRLGDQPWQTRPPAIGLAHELVHADQAVHGTMITGQADNDSKPDPSDPSSIQQTNIRELDATGVPPYDTRPFNENQIREEWHPPQPNRDWY